MLLLAVAAGVFFPSLIQGQGCVDGENLLGECECAGQLFINDNCTQAYYCYTNTTGCLATCKDDEIMIIDPRIASYSCVGRTNNTVPMCPGSLNTECSCEGDDCEFGDCECEDQLWISADCKKARRCRAKFPNGFQEKECNMPDQIVDVNLSTGYMSCIEDDKRCLNASFHTKCDPDVTTPKPNECTYANNTLGTCGCNKQLFINEDCTEGFYCMGGTPEGTDGCSIKCESWELLVVDPREYSWKCLNKTTINNAVLMCPGKFNIDCPCTGDDCGFGECECEGQLWISENCKQGRYCMGGGLGYRDIGCPNLNEIIEVNTVDNTWSCIKDDGRCPGAFHVPHPCPAVTPPPATLCTFSNNSLGECECGRQLFINEDCTEGFYCMESGFPEGVVAQGCTKRCKEDEILTINKLENKWDCSPRKPSPGSLPKLCPGKFKVECPGNGNIGECQCDGQLWIDDNCKNGMYCQNSLPGGFSDISCGEGERIEVNTQEATWECIPDDGQCFGGFHTECESEPPSSASFLKFFVPLLAASFSLV